MKCLKCGTTLNVNFEGMCKKCYEDSIEIIEREEQEIERDKNILNINRFFKEKHIIIEAILLVVVLILIIVCIMINSNKKEVEKDPHQCRAHPLSNIDPKGDQPGQYNRERGNISVFHKSRRPQNLMHRDHRQQ